MARPLLLAVHHHYTTLPILIVKFHKEHPMILILHEERPEIWPLLLNVFSQTPGIELSQEEWWAFNSRDDLDAVVLNERFAYERYGGTPPRRIGNKSLGETRALSTREPHILPMYAPPNMPPWVVALPPLFERIEPFDEETLQMWGEIFQACERLNTSTATPKIQRLGCRLAINFWPAGPTDAERRLDLEAIRRAYLAYYMNN
jgi:hypothetical protein